MFNHIHIRSCFGSGFFVYHRLLDSSMFYCTPFLFCGLIILSVLAAALMFGETWMMASLMAACTCSLFTLVFAIWWGTQEWLYETRFRAREGFNAEAEIAPPAVQGVPAMTGQHVVLGMPAELNVQSTVRMTMNFPERVIGKPMVGHDQQLRAAATVPAWS